ncbi:MAG: tripartite tricarboxylate transporter TctB family protein [Rhodoferax sp.]|uniref:tripartite tricarboxylate transporter TctB family protein n=1 Tax=Rhodoferax sp. TaxID=50421 RepID=UPI0026040656|nr:tripartite tricarboxylate transporter TctB family protein [Rhodoferax sp.]MDD2882279.1 tripartite tricarboxylate transporter TctB family protein [Rhodoferax sp.]
MVNKKRLEFFLGLTMLLVGLGYLWATTNIPRKHDGIDASFVPYILGSLCSFLGVLQLLAAVRLKAAAATDASTSKADYATLWKTLALIVGYVALLSWVGFPIMTVVYLMAQFYVLTPADQKPRWVLYATVAVVTSAVVYLLFRHAFDLILPLGWLDFDTE